MSTAHALPLAVTAASRSSASQLVEADLHKALSERELLLTELTHRVRNTLQLVGSLLSFHSRRTHNPEAQSALGEAQRQILAIAGVYKGLDRGHIAQIQFGPYLRNLCERLVKSVEYAEGATTLTVDAEDGMLDLDQAIPLGLVVNELVSTALADPRGAAHIAVGFRKDGQGEHRLSFTRWAPAMDGNNLVALDEFPPKLVGLLVGQIDGTLSVEQDSGLHVTVAFRAP